MGPSGADLWVARRSADAAVEVVLDATEESSVGKPDIDGVLALIQRAAPGDESFPPSILALTGHLAGVNEDTWGTLITQAARAFRAAEACLTARLGPGKSVEIDEETWASSGLPAPVLEAASCTTSLVAAWPFAGGGWCVLEVDQESSHRPIAVVLYRVGAAGDHA